MLTPIQFLHRLDNSVWTRYLSNTVYRVSFTPKFASILLTLSRRACSYGALSLLVFILFWQFDEGTTPYPWIPFSIELGIMFGLGIQDGQARFRRTVQSAPAFQWLHGIFSAIVGSNPTVEPILPHSNCRTHSETYSASASILPDFNSSQCQKILIPDPSPMASFRNYYEEVAGLTSELNENVWIDGLR